MGQSVSVSRIYSYDLLDVGVAFKEVAESKFGKNCFVGFRHKFYKFRDDVNWADVDLGSGETVRGVIGPVHLKGFPGLFQVNEEEFGSFVSVSGVPEDQKVAAEEFLSAVQHQLEEHSIYRGKAIKFGGRSKKIMDLSKVSESEVIYNESVEKDLEANLWALIENSEACTKIRAPKQHKVLLTGTYGCGKTLAGILTAQKAVKNNRTFVYVAPAEAKGLSSLKDAFAFAKKYLPAVILLEDVDLEQHYDSKNEFLYEEILLQIDGIENKGLEILFIMTTNRPEKIREAMQRPGRIDKVIDMSRFEAKDVERLLKKTIDPEFLSDTIDWNMVGGACKGFTPSYVRAVGENAKFLAVRDSALSGNKLMVLEDHLLSVAKDLSDRADFFKKPSMGFNR